MCLAVPVLVVKRLDADDAIIDAGGVRKQVSLALVPEAREGDYVIVHVGHAIGLLDPGEARRTLELFSSLPAAQAGSGAGIYKMASSLGAAFGVAISAAIFTALSANPESVSWMEGVITFVGRQDNLAVREAAVIALMFNVFMVLVAILSIMLTVPKAGPRKN